MKREAAVALNELFSTAATGLSSVCPDPAAKGNDAYALLRLHAAAILGALASHVFTPAVREHPDVFPSEESGARAEDFLLPAAAVAAVRTSLAQIANDIARVRRADPDDAQLHRGLGEVDRRIRELEEYLEHVSHVR